MPAFDELRNELDGLIDDGAEVNDAFHELVERYNDNADKREQLVLLQEKLESEGHPVTWPDFIS